MFLSNSDKCINKQKYLPQKTDCKTEEVKTLIYYYGVQPIPVKKGQEIYLSLYFKLHQQSCMKYVMDLW